MSAIYGVVQSNTNGKPEDIGLSFVREYEGYRIDRFGEASLGDAFFGCGIQYFTEEAKGEVLPILDRANGLLFTADCLLDNRDALIEMLQRQTIETDLAYDPEHLEILPDGTLIYLLYLLKGEECVGLLRGVFSFAVYDMKNSTVSLFVDQFAGRCLFYSTEGELVTFSTLLVPMLRATGRHREINERWMVDCLSVRGPMMMTEEIETPVKGIFKVDCGCFVKLSLKEGLWATERVVYYDPRKTVKINKRIDDQEAGREFVKVFSNSVANCLRTDGDVAIELSSGLDSSTVAGVAAPMLAAKGRKLYSYTSVPLEGSVENQGAQIFNETEGVQLICDMFPNIVPTFVNCEGKNTKTEMDDTLRIWELPCKSQMNAVWIHEIFRQASGKCKIMLSGSTGNCTISSGAIHDYYYNEIISGHPINAYRSFVHYFNKYGAMKKAYAKGFVKLVLGERIDSLLGRTADCYATNATRREVGEKYELNKRFNTKIDKGYKVSRYRDIRDRIYLRISFAQIGEINTKHSLEFGVIERDPTRNVELIELLLSFPQRMFVDQDYDRRLVREFTEGIVPDEIRFNVRSRGVQGGDNIYRLSQCWPEIRDDIRDAICTETMDHYIQTDSIRERIENFEPENPYDHEDDILLIMDMYSCAKYLERLEKLCN